MAPGKRSIVSPKKTNSRQASLSFKTTKRGVVNPKTKLKAKKANAKAKTKTKEELQSDLYDSSDDEQRVRVKPSVLDVNDKAGYYRRYYREVKKQLGYTPPIHAEGQSKVEKMLRVFDNTYDYGPCVGLTRLERWERAETMGLNPPPEVRDILMTEKGRTDSKLINPVFDGQVL